MNVVYEDISQIVRNTNMNFLSGKTVLITGASGLLGSYFAQVFMHLELSGNGPAKLFLTSKSGKFQFDTGNFTEIIEGNLANGGLLSGLPNADIIIHAAGYGQPGKFLENEFLTLELNTTVTLSLINKVKQGGKFLFLSSSEVYSGLGEPPFSENQIGTTNTDHPRSAYIEAKRTGEAITHVAYKRGKIGAKSVRLSLAYGPGTKIDDSRVLNSFIRQAILNKRIEMIDTGQSMRTYCYLTDAIEMCLEALGKGNDPIYNVGGVSRIRIRELAKLICESTGSELVSPPNDNHALTGAPNDVWLNLSKITDLNNKKNFISMQEGVKRTINWQKNNLYNV